MMGMMHYVRPGSRARIVAGDTPKWILNNKRSRYIKSVVLSAPPWVRFKDFAKLRAEAQFRTKLTGILHVLGHIVPINHPYVCGLTVPWNLQVVTNAWNNSKGNSWSRGQTDLFTQPEQFQLFIQPAFRRSTHAMSVILNLE